MNEDESIRALAKVLGHEFGHLEVLKRAVTHASAEPRAWNAYERLEFLGDRVVALVLAEHLLDRFPHEREGPIAKRHVGLVRKEALAEVARSIDLGSFLVLSRGEGEGGARDSDSILSDAMEAVIAALYLDGGLDVARDFILRNWNPLVEADRRPPQDAKTELQELLQGRGKPLPVYEVVERVGPSHAPIFTIEVQASDAEPCRAQGKSKRSAEQAAAAEMLKALREVTL